MTRHHVVLVPGFFGFGSFGDLSYFHGVRPALERSFERLGLGVSITEVKTLPTASIRVRAARLLETLVSIAAADDGPIHIVGHSTGGLDARLAIAPTASLPASSRLTTYDRIQTLVTVCCPHFGSPVATHFSSSMGKPLLRLFARYFVWVLERGRIPLAIALRVGYWIVRLRDPFKRRKSTFDELYEKLLNDLSAERRAELVKFLKAISSDQSLVFQLTPAGCDLLNACTADPAVRYGSVVARAPGASWRRLPRSVWDLYAQIMYPVYAVLHYIAGRAETELIPEAIGAQRERLLEFWGELPSARDNDGIVPTNSQIWGEVIHAATADHLDVVGHFGSSAPQSPAADWIPSESGFDLDGFERLWDDVAAFIVAEVRAELPPTDNVGTDRTERDLP
jgi:triacylglycerol lipase